MGGGSMIREVWTDRSTWADPPARFEAGTPNIADAIGLGRAVDYLSAIGLDAIREHEIELVQYTLERLHSLPGVTVYGPTDSIARSGVVSFNLTTGGDLIHPHDVSSVLDGLGIAIRAGHHCCQPIMRRLDVPATARASFYLYNSRRDVDALIDGLERARELFA
jgi:cysteine desulfurase/selenocysteine lyase